MKFSIIGFGDQEWISVPEEKTGLYKTTLTHEGISYVPLKTFIVRNSWDIFRGEDIRYCHFYPESNTISITLKETVLQGAKILDIADVLHPYGVDWYIESCDDVIYEDDGHTYSCLKLIICL